MDMIEVIRAVSLVAVFIRVYHRPFAMILQKTGRVSSNDIAIFLSLSLFLSLKGDRKKKKIKKRGRKKRRKEMRGETPLGEADGGVEGRRGRSMK